jgi:hypothetical protein
VLDIAHGFQRVQTFPGIGAFDAAGGYTFAGNGQVHYWTSSSVFGSDSPGDGVDSNCTGFDF